MPRVKNVRTRTPESCDSSFSDDRSFEQSFCEEETEEDSDRSISDESVNLKKDESATGESEGDEKTGKFKNAMLQILLCAKRHESRFAVSKEIDKPPILVIEIQDVGPVHFPLYEEQAKRILGKFDQAPFGKREETLVDTTVRNTKQLDPNFFKILNSSWDTFLKEEILTTVSKSLFIETPIVAHLYKLLVYEPGSFFKPHQDTEKESGMFGTLVIQLPSIYSGGELVVKHQKRTKRFNFSSLGHEEKDREFKMFFAAFFCDCRHEVLPVTEGYRVCLVYNLVASQTDITPGLPDVGELETRMHDFTKTWEEGKPSKIVYVLEHEYTQWGLSLLNMKSVDRQVVNFIKNCAAKCSLTVHLALLTKHESGGAAGSETSFEMIDPEYSYGLESMITVDDMQGKIDKLAVDYGSEVIPPGCFKGLEPHDQDYMEYSGNEGATAERWYSAAAVVFWPEAHTVDVLDEGEASAKVVAKMYLNAYEQYIADHSNANTDGLEEVLKWLYLLTREKPDRPSLKDELLSKVLSSVIALDDLTALKRLFSRFNFMKRPFVQTVIKQCDKHGWEILGASIVEMFKKCPLNAQTLDVLLLFIPSDSPLDQKKKEVLCECLKRILELSVKSPWSYLGTSQQGVNPLWDEKGFLRNAYLAAFKLDFDMCKYAKYSPIALSQVLLELTSLTQASVSEIWIKSVKICMEQLSKLASEVPCGSNLTTKSRAPLDKKKKSDRDKAASLLAKLRSALGSANSNPPDTEAPAKKTKM